MCHCCGWGVAGRAGPHVLQYQTCWQVTPGKYSVLDELANSRPPACPFCCCMRVFGHEESMLVGLQGVCCP